MEVDELDTGLVEQFGSLQTVDHADLVQQMRRLVGGEVSESYAKFYLEMSNWNVHAAVGYYFDLNGSSGSTGPAPIVPLQPLTMTFVRDVTIGEGESVPPSTHFTKTWTVSNPGAETWSPGCCLKFVHGERLQADDKIDVGRCLRPGETMDISVRMMSPERPGIYESQWRMATASGVYFGDTIWVILTVEPSGTLALTQQMDQFHDLGATSSSSSLPSPAIFPANGVDQSPSAVINPFASPPRPRPTSPTDRDQTAVSARSFLDRFLRDRNHDEEMN